MKISKLSLGWMLDTVFTPGHPVKDVSHAAVRWGKLHSTDWSSCVSSVSIVPWMNEWRIIYNAHKNFPRKNMHVHSSGLGRKKHTILHLHTVKSIINTARAHTHTVMTSWKEDYKLWKKDVLRADLKERGQSVSLILMGRAFHREGAIYLKVRWLYRFVVQSLGPGTARNASLSNQREQDRVCRGMSSER